MADENFERWGLNPKDISVNYVLKYTVYLIVVEGILWFNLSYGEGISRMCVHLLSCTTLKNI